MQMRVAPQPVAMARICLGLVAVLNSIEAYDLLSEIAGGKIRLPVHDVLPAPTESAVNVYLVVSLLAAMAIMLGWRTAPAAAVLTVVNVGVLLWDQQTYSSHRFLMTLLLGYLIFARSDAAWSVAPRGGSVPWWPQMLMMTQLSVCYLFAAISKVSLVFLSGAPLSLWVWVPLPWWMFTLMAVGTVLVELYLAVGLWNPSTRRKAAVLGVLLHVGIVTMLRDETVPLIAFALTCVGLYWLFLSRPNLGVVRPWSAGISAPKKLQFSKTHHVAHGPVRAKSD